MADVALVSLAIDATGVKAGERESIAAFQAIERAMGAAEKAFLRFNQQSNANAGKVSAGLKETGRSATNMGIALSGLGGPVGSLAGQVTLAVGQLQEMTSAFGTVGGVALTAAAAVVAVGSAITKLALDGVKLSDTLGDIRQALGFAEQDMEELNAAARLSGEDIGVVERSFAAFEGAIKQGLTDPASEANNALRKLGVDSKVAFKDTHTGYKELIKVLPEVTGNFEKMAAARELFGRQTNSLIRLGDEYNRVLKLTNKQLQDMGFTVSGEVNRMNAASDKALSEMSLKWDNFKRQLASEWAPAIVGALESITQAMRDVKTFAPPASVLGGFGIQGIATGIVARGTAPAQRGAGAGTAPSRAELIAAGRVELPPIPPAAKGGAKPIDLAGTISDLNEANRAATAYYDAMKAVAESFYAAELTKFDAYTKEITRLDAAMREARLQNARNTEKFLQDQLAGLKPGSENFKRVQEELFKVQEAAVKLADQLQITVLPAIDKISKATDAFLGVKPFVGPAPPIAPRGRPGAGQFPQAPREVEAIHAEDITVERGATRPRIFAESLPSRPRRVEGERDAALEQLDAQFASLFDGFLTSIITAQQTVGGAFAGLALGIVDTFAQQFVISLRQQFIDPVIKGLTDMLSEALNDLFSGLSGGGAGGGGLKGVFGGLVKGIGTMFGGWFATGGTLGPGKFGIAGERGPELLFSGNQPMHIAPVTAGSAGNVFTINVGVNAPAGTVDRRTHDQLAATVLNAVRRAERNQGAR